MLKAAVVNHSEPLLRAVHEEWRRAAETGAWLALAMVHADQFDPRLFVALRWALPRSCDILVRTGDTAFSVIFPHTKFAGAKRVMDRFTAIAAALELEENKKPLTISVGVSAFIAAGDNSMYLLLDDAHDALEQAKAQ